MQELTPTELEWTKAKQELHALNAPLQAERQKLYDQIREITAQMDRHTQDMNDYTNSLKPQIYKENPTSDFLCKEDFFTLDPTKAELSNEIKEKVFQYLHNTTHKVSSLYSLVRNLGLAPEDLSLEHLNELSVWIVEQNRHVPACKNTNHDSTRSSRPSQPKAPSEISQLQPRLR